MSGEIEGTARGHLAADAVVKVVNGQEVAELRMAVSVRRKDSKGEWQDHRTDWVDVTCWGSRVGGAATLVKGQLVEVRGSLTPAAYIDKGGEAQPSTKLTARSVTVVPRPPKVGAK